MKRSNTRLGPPEGQERGSDAWTGAYGSITQRVGACGEPVFEAGEGPTSAPDRAPYYNIGLPKKAAPQGEGGGPPPRLMNIRQLSGYMAMPVATIYTWVCLRRVPASCIVRLGRSLRFDREAVDRWIEEQRVVP